MLATGSAFVGGSMPSSGRAFSGTGVGGLINVPGHKYTTTTTTTTTTTSGGGSGSGSGSGSKAKDTKKAKEVFDWIEVKIKRLEQALDSLGRTADSVYRTWDTRNRALGSSITKTSDMIKLQETAAARYLAQANKDAGNLSAYWKNRVQNGAIDISAIKDEKLAEKIKAYQQW